MTNERVQIDQKGPQLHLTLCGTWRYTDQKTAAEKQAISRLFEPTITSLSLNEDRLLSWDSSLVVFLVQIVRTCRQRKIALETHLSPGLARLLDLTFAVKRQEGSERKQNDEGFLTSLGSSVLEIFPKSIEFLTFFGEIVSSLFSLLRGNACMRGRDFWQALHECSLQALPIVSITNLLFGLILAFVGAIQLTQFGVQIYVAGLVGIGTARVMGAVMVGIVMAGRVGASYAALLGTMQVNEEIDALTTLGISPVDFLVLPRMLALVFMVPLLTLYADLMGIFGGYLVGTIMLGIGPLEYINATISMVNFRHVIIGICYATSFGFVIAIAGCYQGIRCGRSAQAVGLATTTAVVHSIVGIIVMTAIITIACNILGV